MVTIGAAQRRGTTSVSSSATHRLTGTPMMIAITEVSTVPKTNDIAPNWAVETAIPMRMARTRRPAQSASSWNPRSPRGRRRDSESADPAGLAGSAFVAVVTTPPVCELRASRIPPKR